MVRVVAPANGEAEDNVTVQPLAGLQGHLDRAVCVRRRGDRVQAGPDGVRRESQAGQASSQREPDRAREARQQHRRGDAACIGNGIGVGGGAAADRRPRQRLAGDVSRRDDERKAVLSRPSSMASGPVRVSVITASSPGCRLPTRWRRRRSALLIDRGAVAGGDRGVVLRPRLAALPQLALDAAACEVGERTP